MLKKLLLVYNARSSHHAEIEQGVLAPLRSLKGWMVGKYAIKPTSFDENAANLARLVGDGDLVLIAGGDGTATMAINAVLDSGKDATVAVLGYGNFDDIANMLGMRHATAAEGARYLERAIEAFLQGQTQQLYPLEVKVNQQHWRYAPCYTSMGLLAQATTMLEETKIRQQANTGKRGAFYFWRKAVLWYLRHHRKNYLPAGKLNAQPWPAKATDYLAVNGPTLAQIIKGGDWWRDRENFGSSLQRLGNFWAMSRFGLRSVTKGMPLVQTQQDVIEFDAPSSVQIHVEGEFEQLSDVKQVEITKSKHSIKVITLPKE